MDLLNEIVDWEHETIVSDLTSNESIVKSQKQVLNFMLYRNFFIFFKNQNFPFLNKNLLFPFKITRLLNFFTSFFTTWTLFQISFKLYLHKVIMLSELELDTGELFLRRESERQSWASFWKFD